MENDKSSQDKLSFFDNPQNVKRVLNFLYGGCALLFILDFVIHRHTIHPWEKLWGFYAIYGFVGCVILVLVATWMRTFLMRSEDYYDNEENGRHSKNHNDNSRKNDSTNFDSTNLDSREIDSRKIDSRKIGGPDVDV